jgi:hypothetical protein
MKRIEPNPRSDNIQVEFTAVQTPPKRLKERHFLERIPPMGKKARPHRKCVVCTRRAREKRLSIGAVLCLQGCFKAYHTLLNSKPPASIAEIQGAHIIK